MPQSERPDMAAYGEPVDDPEGLLPWSWAESRLVACRNYWLTTVDPDAKPHSMPVWGLWHVDTERFWFSCAPTALKARNLAANPHVVVAIEDTIEVVAIEGVAALQPADQSIAKAIGIKYEDDPERRLALDEFFLSQPMYVVTPVKGFGVIEHEDQFGPRATRWVW